MRDNYPNHFEQIYQAALKQDPNLLPNGSYCIDEFKQGHFGLSAAAMLASEGNKAAAEWLRQRGANIDYIAYGAAKGGRTIFAKAMVKKGANIQLAVEGAAQGGYITFAKELIKNNTFFISRTAFTSLLVMSAAKGEYISLAKKLIKKGADLNISLVAQGAAQGGHITFAKALIKEGADINRVAHGAAESGHIASAISLIIEDASFKSVASSFKPVLYGAVITGRLTNDNVPLLLRLLSQIANDQHRSLLANEFSQVRSYKAAELINDLKFHYISSIKPAILKRASTMARLRHVYGYTFPTALLSTRVTKKTSTPTKTVFNIGALAMLAGMGFQQSATQKLPLLPYEIWMKVFEFVFNETLTLQQFDLLSFLTTRLPLIHQLTDYQSNLWFYQSSEKQITEQLIHAVLKTENMTALATYVGAQHRQLNPQATSNTTPATTGKGKEKIDTTQKPSTLPEIFRLWHHRLGNPTNKLEIKNTSSSSRISR